MEDLDVLMMLNSLVKVYCTVPLYFSQMGDKLIEVTNWACNGFVLAYESKK